MSKLHLEEIKLIGLALNRKTSNANGQSSIDCGNLWQQFEKENYIDKIPNKLTDEIVAVYHEYEGNHTQPFSYFIGCKVPMDTKTPIGMESLIIPNQIYQKIIAKGEIPNCLINAWKEIWSSSVSRAYKTDFEVYDERSKDWSNAEVDIYISIH
ncbi:MAG TPA: effector binding domain-containing protein [Flavobacterium sp.]|uniref:GyrI-like domain-containing protein n=1 Tax=Flavobacterium sp. TaxID=239 RepID=UPI002DB778EE|nr:effector binding domain-containing protein [Flavobacterium sp.]HEU4789726.1 effector binding domain-containing protein [Flavobacterium sp.]